MALEWGLLLMEGKLVLGRGTSKGRPGSGEVRERWRDGKGLRSFIGRMFPSSKRREVVDEVERLRHADSTVHVITFLRKIN